MERESSSQSVTEIEVSITSSYKATLKTRRLFLPPCAPIEIPAIADVDEERTLAVDRTFPCNFSLCLTKVLIMIGVGN